MGLGLWGWGLFSGGDWRSGGGGGGVLWVHVGLFVGVEREGNMALSLDYVWVFIGDLNLESSSFFLLGLLALPLFLFFFHSPSQVCKIVYKFLETIGVVIRKRCEVTAVHKCWCNRIAVRVDVTEYIYF